MSLSSKKGKAKRKRKRTASHTGNEKQTADGPKTALAKYEEIKAYLKESTGDSATGVFYDGGWEDTRNGTYTLEPDNQEIDSDTFQKLRKEGFLGGNVLITFKARRWHPALAEGQSDESKLGDKFYRENPYPLPGEVKDNDSSDDIVGSLLTNCQKHEKTHVTWIEFSDDAIASEIPAGMVLVTNNIDAVDNDDYMTHVWIAKVVKRHGQLVGLENKRATGFPSFSESTMPVRTITHWAPVPKAWNLFNGVKCLPMKAKSAKTYVVCKRF